MSIFNYSAQKMNGQEISLEQYKGKTIIIVNTASKCGFTPQYEDLQKLYERYQDKGLVILGFPCNQFGQEIDNNEDIQTFCQINYGVSFPLFGKVDVRGEQAHPLFQYLIKAAPFQGFKNNSVSRLLKAMIESEHPELLGGDSIKWNFTKFLINKEGQIVKRFEPADEPFDMEADIEKLL